MSSSEEDARSLSPRDDVFSETATSGVATPLTGDSLDGEIHRLSISEEASEASSNKDSVSSPTISTPISASSTMTETVPPGANANISTRMYIYFLGPYPLPDGTPIPYTPQLHLSNPLNLSYDPMEPTSTLVLTSPASTFVDLRILKPLSTNAPALPNTGGPAGRVEWAFAGTSFSHSISGREDEDVTHSIWRHQVDTKYTLDEDIPVDEGDMYSVGDGRVLEFGHAWNRAIGYDQAYEELWDDIDIRPTYPSTSNVCVVMRLENPKAVARGVIIRLGQFCQGILRQGSQWVVERWEFVEEMEGEGTNEEKIVGGNWQRTVKVGDMFLPCAVAFQTDVVPAVGMKVKVDGGEWFVEESTQWVDEDSDVEGEEEQNE